MTGLWYCPSYCMRTNEIREFRVDRIVEIIEEKSYTINEYKIPSSIQKYLESLENGTDYHLKISLTEKGVKRCETEFLLAQGLKVFPNRQGIIDMKIRKSTLEWVANYFLSFGNNATIIEPLELKELIRSKIIELHNQYFE